MSLPTATCHFAPRVPHVPPRSTKSSPAVLDDTRPARSPIPPPSQSAKKNPIFGGPGGPHGPVCGPLRSPPRDCHIPMLHCHSHSRLAPLFPACGGGLLPELLHHHHHTCCSVHPSICEDTCCRPHGCLGCSEEASAAYEKCKNLALQLSRAQSETSTLYLQLSAAHREYEQMRAVYEARLREAEQKLETYTDVDFPQLEHMLLHAESLADHLEQVRDHSHAWSVWSSELLCYLRSLHERCCRGFHCGDVGAVRHDDNCIASPQPWPSPYTPAHNTYQGSPPLPQGPTSPSLSGASPHRGGGERGRSQPGHGRRRRTPTPCSNNRSASPCCSVSLNAAEVEEIRARAGCSGPVLMVRDVQPQSREPECEGPRRRVLRDPQIFDYVT